MGGSAGEACIGGQVLLGAPPPMPGTAGGHPSHTGEQEDLKLCYRIMFSMYFFIFKLSQCQELLRPVEDLGLGPHRPTVNWQRPCELGQGAEQPAPLAVTLTGHLSPGGLLVHSRRGRDIYIVVKLCTEN